MHLHPAHDEMRIVCHSLVGRGRLCERNSELVCGLAGGDLGVGVRVNVGIDADCNGGLHSKLSGDVVDAGHLGVALHVEGVDPMFEGEGDFLLGFTHTCKDALVDVSPGCQDPTQFAAADEIKGRPEIREQAQHRQRGVCLHRVADLQIEASERLRQAGEIVRNR